MSRAAPPNRRPNMTVNVSWNSPEDVDHKLIITFGLDGGRINEVFCAGFRRDSSICALMNDACIILSRLLQHGERVGDLATKLSENRAEGREAGPPASMMGAILRAAAAVEREIADERNQV